ncbi:probable fatty acid methyltransferase [Phtheirospermum japonicum]|uniref:Probable fatty acid methyltransferase n=1 Tax=Phtheirospermum japonicum TaxID=374723 RepID=A0A830BRY7_9LAMI|nr:probable fatty acid methyltransferase [Phtheirospermum japonicum]
MSRMRVAVVGGGVSGLAAAYVAAEAGAEVVLYEKDDYLGGHAKTVTIDGTSLDLGFMVFNRVTYPNMMAFFESLGVDMELSDMSFAVSLDKGLGCEWGSRNGLSGLFAQKKNIMNPYFWKMIKEVIQFKDDVLNYLEELDNNPDIDRNETLDTDMWFDLVMLFRRSNELLCIFHTFVLSKSPSFTAFRSSSMANSKVRQVLESKGCRFRINAEVCSVSSNDSGCSIRCKNGSEDTYDECIIAAHAPDALEMLGKQATFDELRILGAFQYAYSDVYLHRDKKLMPRNTAAWSAWNFLGTINKKVCVTYWLNILQNISETGLPFLVTLNPPSTPEHTLLKWLTGHPIPSVAATKASTELNLIQGKRRIWFCGAYQGARLLVTRFLKRFIAIGCITLLEDGGTMFVFEGKRKTSPLKVYLRIHSPQFYWKIATEADLGLADAYINGDFSFVDKNEGLVNLFMIFIANRDLSIPTSNLNNKGGWWTPLLFTSALASAKYFIQHVSRKNTLTQARRNISRHYDLSNELFSLFLDETMAYSCAIFKAQDEDLKIAQYRKISLLIEKARVSKNHRVLEIGCGWGTLAIEVVKRTGCKYTGITLSQEQLKYAEIKVKEAGLQDHIKFLLCDYRQLPETGKYDRIISCEMLEAVGHEYMEDFFRCCDSVLEDDGLLVLQFISIPDGRYDEYRRSSDFIKEYIFPGGCLPSLSRVASAMAAASTLCVEHLEDIGIHYYQTLRCWRENFLGKQRTWEYYFDYCAAGFKTCTLGNYQIVFSRPGNVAAFGDPYEGVPSAY